MKRGEDIQQLSLFSFPNCYTHSSQQTTTKKDTMRQASILSFFLQRDNESITDLSSPASTSQDTEDVKFQKQHQFSISLNRNKNILILEGESRRVLPRNNLLGLLHKKGKKKTESVSEKKLLKLSVVPSFLKDRYK